MEPDKREICYGILKFFNETYGSLPNFYSTSDFETLLNKNPQPRMSLKTLDELLEQDKHREKDGFPKKIKIGRLVRGKGKGKKTAIVPVVEEEKFLHDNRKNFEDKSTGGTGEEEEGEIIIEIPIDWQCGGGTGAGDEGGGDHDIQDEAYELGRILVEKFELPNLKEKGKKRSFSKYKYDLTDKNRKTGQILDKKRTLREIIKTNMILGRASLNEPINPKKLIINPNDMIYRILSREKDYESEAVVFFLRDYSGSMYGKPADFIVRQHLMIYSWLMFQYQKRVKSRFIVHDTEAKEVPDFYTYYNSIVHGGTNISSAFNLTNKIVEEENLAKDYNIYIFYGSDGDDWYEGTETTEEIKKILTYANRTGLTVVGHGRDMRSTFEHYMLASGLLKQKKLIRLNRININAATEDTLIESIKHLISENGTS